ncbi:nucleotidyltransferase domain-containing protein [bacterium]|nr:nucleotidyltransferase domain-containing protein [bacterium]
MKKNIDEKTKNKIIRLILALFPTAKIYLFGSRATKTHSMWSDIDIAIDTGEKIPFVLVGEVIDVLKGTDIPYMIDVVDFHDISDVMKQSILKEGIIWKK